MGQRSASWLAWFVPASLAVLAGAPTSDHPLSLLKKPGAVAQAVNNSCNDIVPALGTPQYRSQSALRYGICRNGTSDSMGVLAFGIEAGMSEAGDGAWYLYDPSTQRELGTIYAPPILAGTDTFQSLWGLFFPRPPYFRVDFYAWTDDARQLAHHRIDQAPDDSDRSPDWRHALDINGGSLVLYLGQSAQPEHKWRIEAWRFDASGQRRHEPVVVAVGAAADRPAWMVGGLNLLRESVILYEFRGRAQGVWVASNGSVLARADLGTAPRPIPHYMERFGEGLTLAPLYDLSLALRVSGEWIWTIPNSKNAGPARPAPDWLASRPNTKLEPSLIKAGISVGRSKSP